MESIKAYPMPFGGGGHNHGGGVAPILAAGAVIALLQNNIG